MSAGVRTSGLNPRQDRSFGATTGLIPRDAIIVQLVAAFVAAVFCTAPLRAEPLDAPARVATLPPIGDHWVWVPDAVFAHSLLFDGDTGEVMGTIDGGSTISPKPPLLSRARGEFYSVEIDYSRGQRGDRLDYVTIYDSRTLEVTGEVLLPTRTSESAASLGYAVLLDGDRFLATFNQFPATSVSIVDLETRSFVEEIVTSGCAGIYPTGERSFAMLCGDGSLLRVTLDGSGRKLGMNSARPFFDVIQDPVVMAAGRTRRGWLFVSFAGVAHEVDLSQTPMTLTSWSLVDETQQADGWIPGGRQLVALHEPSGRLFVVFHQGGAGSHKSPGPEVWVFDLALRKRVDRFEMPNFTAAFLGSVLKLGGNGFTGWLLDTLLPDDGADTITVSQDGSPLLFARNSQMGAVAVFDAQTGEHLRNLDEVGLAGMRLEVPPVIGVDPVVEWVTRLSLALLLLTTARHKLWDLSRFTATIRDYRILPRPAARLAALLLTGTELAVAILLLTPAADPFGPVAALGLITLYSAAIGINLARGRREMDCGCLGPMARQALTPGLLVRNAALALASALLLLRDAPRPISWIDAISIMGGVGILAILWGAAHQLAAAQPALRSQERST